MAINFDRNRVQLRLENIINPLFDPFIYDPQNTKNFKSAARLYTLTNLDEVDLQREIFQDANDIFYNGCVSFLEGMDDILTQHFSWACVKLYYAIFYLCRAQLAYKNYAIFRIGGDLFSLKIKSGAQITRCKEHTTHKATYEIYHREIPDSYILSNEVDGVSSITWYANLREIINYRARRFLDPERLCIFEKFDSQQTVIRNLDLLKNDTTGLIFLEDYAVIGIPLRLLKDVVNGCGVKLNDLQKEYIHKLLNPKLSGHIF